MSKYLVKKINEIFANYSKTILVTESGKNFNKNEK